MELRNSFDIFSKFLCLYLNNENTVTPGTLIILGSLTDNSIGVANKQQVERIFLILSPVNREALEYKLPVSILLHPDPLQVIQVLR